MDLIFIIILIIIVILFLLFIWSTKINNKKINTEYNRCLYNQRKDHKNKISMLENCKEIEKISMNNIKNAIEFYNKLNGKKYIWIYEVKHKEYSNEKQNIVMVFYEHNIIYDMSYFEDEVTPNIMETNDKYKKTLNLECNVYVDDRMYTPLLLKNIEIGKVNRLIIDDINLGSLTGRGIGTAIIKSLECILPNYGISRLNAPISSVDYDKRKLLENFYCNINNFEMVREVTPEEWGLAVKKLIENN
ncbi:hypothetical protein KPL42_01460 [Clostridium gasigenes]|uniref:hypothetical protein n=1 Tax=Clostridium gasigenes TaxID=94869 RepID=UPI001C0C7C11|nr:hypothetical protein [Clostridium gasigenes]MBU3087152.1 hypothetical protein [Clostridium gasigenes]